MMPSNPKFISNSNPKLAEIANLMLAEHEEDIRKIVVMQVVFAEIYGREAEVHYEIGCRCMGDYCEHVFLHGCRLDSQSIKDLEMKWKVGKYEIKS